MRRRVHAVLCLAVAGLLDAAAALAEQEYGPSDALFGQVLSNVTSAGTFDVIAEIDHSRLAAEAGEDMPPSRVLIFSDPALDAALMAVDPRLGVDLPLRILAFEVEPGGENRILFNDTAYLEHRYDVTLPQAVRDSYRASVDAALAGVGPERIAGLAPDALDGDGLITLESPHDFDETLRRVREAVSAQDDTVWFGEVDFDERARAVGVAIEPAQLLLFGGPGPGGRAMAKAPSLGLDAFCQKVLVLQDDTGEVRVIMNDLLDLAERHDVSKSLPLRVINRRIQKTFSDALRD